MGITSFFRSKVASHETVGDPEVASLGVPEGPDIQHLRLLS
jgi:hypothetical protein